MLENRLLVLPNDYEDRRLYLATASIGIKELFEKTIELLQLLTERSTTNE